jgi:FKBP-type peptidyl-prolyl cis-trans isomerase
MVGAGNVISGWDQGVIGMKVGEIRRLRIPSNLGYGAAGAGSSIPANSDLIFDVELVSFSN